MKKILLALIIGLLMPTSLWAQENIQFADDLVKELCVQHWDTNGDGELSTDEAAAVTDLADVFHNQQRIVNFDELRFFTGLTEIGSSAFFMCVNLISIQLPETVKAIRSGAFSYCWWLPRIEFPEALTTIEESAFRGCEVLDDIIFPEGLINIGDAAFSGVDAMRSVFIPYQVSSIGEGAFYGKSLVRLEVDERNTYYDSREQCNGIIETATNKLIAGCNSTHIPTSVTAIAEYVFIYCTFNSIQLPPQLETIGWQAFCYCENLQAIDFPETLREIHTLAFGDCKALTSINIPSDVTVIGSEAFKGCESLTSVTVNRRDPIPTYDVVFSESTYANAILYVPAGTKERYQATESWLRFQNIEEFGEPVQREAEPYAVLSDNNTVLTFYYDDQKDARGGMSVGPFNNYSERPWNNQAETITSVVFNPLMADCTTITSTADWFNSLHNLMNITGLEYLNTSNVTTMRNMFYECRMLTNLDLSTFNTENVTNMAYMFDTCLELTTLNVSSFNTSNVTDMTCMFLDCLSLRNLDVSHFNTENVTSIHGMFFGCSSLTSIDVSNFKTQKVTDMHSMFVSCTGLTNLNLSSFSTESATNMSAMFRECSSLAAIQAGSANIPDSVYAEIGNPNLLVYVNDAALAPASVQNVVINGQAQNIILTDVAEGNGNFYCPQEFQAEQISYSRNFTQTTEVGVSRGWESIALPFDVQSIVHETKGTIIPFGSTADGYNFWLRRMGDNGLEQATQIEANRGYVISMPNSNDYPEEYRLNGMVRFSAQQTMVPVTQPTAAEYTVTNESVTLIPTFRRMAASDDVYALNVGENRGGYPEGSVFERALRDVRPFEAYTTHRAAGGSRARYFSLKTLGADNSLFTAIRNTTKDGADNETVKVYNLSGVLLREGRRNEAMRNLPKGVYIVGGQRVIVSQ